MQSLISLFFLLVSLHAFAEHEVDLLLARHHAKSARFELIQNEKHMLRYNTFIFTLDETGQEVLGHLVNAAKRGVKVRIVLDGIDTGLVTQGAYLEALKEMGIEVRVFNPKYRHMLSMNNRNHIKVLIGEDLMINGGRNTEANYFKEYIDVEARVSGSEVKQAKKMFDKVFDSEQVKPPLYTVNEVDVIAARADLGAWAAKASKTNYTTNRRATKVDKLTYHADPPNLKDKIKYGIRNDVLKMIEKSFVSLEFMNPYFLPSPEQLKAMKAAIDRGVKITVRTNSAKATDSRLVAMAWEIKKHELVEMGITVYESDRYVHAKTIIRDGKEIFIGSKNLDMRSQDLNLENGDIFKSKKLAADLARHQQRLGKMFMKELPGREMPKTKAGFCAMTGIRRIISGLAYPHL